MSSLNADIIKRAEFAKAMLSQYLPQHGPTLATKSIDELLELLSEDDTDEDVVLGNEVANIRATGNFVPVNELKKNVKLVECHKCMIRYASVPMDYEPEWCCDGTECGCHGEPMNPAWCDYCEARIFDRVGRG